MTDFVAGLNKSLPQIISLAALTSCFDRIGVAAYRDVEDSKVTEWSGWYCSPSCTERQDEVDKDTLQAMASSIRAEGGGDFPEAAKTGLALAYSKMRPTAKTIIILYADAPPHFAESGGPNYFRERRLLVASKSQFGPSDSSFVDWVQASRLLRKGPKRGIVFPIMPKQQASLFTSYTFLSTVTGGDFFLIKHVSAELISQLTVGLLLTWMRLGNTTTMSTETMAGILRYKSTSGIAEIKAEDSEGIERFFAYGLNPLSNVPALRNSTQSPVSLATLADLVKARGPKMSSLYTMYKNNPEYKAMAIAQIRQIIELDVSVISVNPVFSSLWRAICADREYTGRNELLVLFSQKVERLSKSSEKLRMRSWLEASYDHIGDINEMLANVPEAKMFPQVYLDPTEVFADEGDETEDGSNPTSSHQFTRAEILEIGRSCDYRILRRIGKALTRLRYAEIPDDVPLHIKSSDPEKVPRIPMAMAGADFGHQFWNILLHLVLPGTRLSDRAGALVAALSLRMGIAPLRNAAYATLTARKDSWNTIDAPENWSVGCLSLLLQADADYECRIAEGASTRPMPGARVLSKKDRDMFKVLVEYKLLELNLGTTLSAKVAWKPYKIKSVLGPLVQCRACRLPRSVTVMGPNSVCGICTAIEASQCSCKTCQGSGVPADCVSCNVTAEMTEISSVHWVECQVMGCRGQYVIYNAERLKGKSKCFYCRHKNEKFGRAPLVECRTCLSRVIWPEEYRPSNFDAGSYKCPGCIHGRKTVVQQDTTAQLLREENGSDWLIRNEANAIKELFNHRSVFDTASNCDRAKLSLELIIFPNSESALSLEINKRVIHNPEQVRDELKGWVESRRVETGSCGLCFSNVKKVQLRLACGRRGCPQLICNGCRQQWYGMNRPGQIINIAAMHCPFCRRMPTHSVIRPFAIASLAGLQRTIDNNGTWIHAWCRSCDTARQYMERVCAAGAPENLQRWRCDDCELENARKLRSKFASLSEPVKPCPGCNVMTVKDGGCNHMSCPCGTHWCYICGGESTGTEIYSHIADYHSGVVWAEAYQEAEWEGGEEVEIVDEIDDVWL